MDFFSGLKKAYDSLGEEFTKTFDSSQSGEDTATSGGSPREQDATPRSHQTSPGPTSDGDQPSVYTTPLAVSQKVDQSSQDDEGWGKWEDQPLMSATTKTKEVSRSPRGGSPASSLEQGHLGMKPQQRHGSILKPEERGSQQTPSPQPKSPLASSTPAKAAEKSKLDSLSREDLMKYVRKQAQLLQKSKAKCDELTKENEKLKLSSEEAMDGQTKTSGGMAATAIDGLMEELQVVRSERDKTVQEEKTLRQLVTLLQQEKEELSDSHKALQEAHSKLKKFCQQQQEQLEVGKSTSGEVEMKLSKMSADLDTEKANTEQLKLKLTSVEEQLVHCQQDKEKELARLMELNKNLSDEKLQWEQTNKQLVDEVKVLRNELDSSKTALEGDVTTLRDRNEEASREVADLKEQLARAVENADAERETRTTLESVIEKMRVEASKLKEEIQNGDASVEELSSENTKLKESCEKFETDVGRLERNVKELCEQLEAAKKEKEELKESTEVSRGQFDREKAQLEEQLNELKSQLEVTGSKLASSLEKNTKLEETVASVQSENGSLREEVATLTTSVEELERNQLTQTSEGSEVAKQLSQAQSQLKDREAELEQVRQQLSESELKLSSQTSDFEDLLKKDEELQRTVECVQNENESLKNRVSNLSSTVELNSQNESAKLITQLKESESTLKEREAQLELLRSELERMKSDIEERESRQSVEYETLKSRESDFNIKVSELEGQLSALQVKYSALEEEREQLKSKQDEATQSITAELELTRKKVESIQSEKDALSKQLLEGKSELDKVCEERDKLKKSFEEQTTSHKEESKKLKAFIMKMKKELSEARERESGLKQQLEGGQLSANAEVESLKSQLQQLTVTMETQQQSIAEGKAREEHISELEKQIEVLGAKLGASEREVSDVEKRLSCERDEVTAKLQQLAESHDVLLSEMASAQSDLATANSQANTHKLASEKAMNELQSVKEELVRERQCHEEVRQKLAAAEKELKSSAVMNLELEDYQRSMKSLEEQLSSRSDELEKARRDDQLHQDSMTQLRKELELMDQQRSQSEETVTKLKQLLMRNKKELGESKKREGELQQAVDDLHSKMEAEKQTAELAKVEISQMAARIQSLQSQSESSVDTLHRTIRSLEHKLGVVQGELGSTQTALANSQQDYEQYKVRVHSVLKQKTSAPAQSDTNNELKQRYESELEGLRAELKDVKDRLSSTLADHEDLLVEHDQLASRHEQLLLESEESKETFQRQMRTEEARHSTQRQEQSEMISQLRQEVEDVTNAFKNQLHSLQDDHHKVMASLKEELSVTQTKLNRLQREADAKVLARAATGNGNKQGGGAVGVANKVPVSLEVKAPPVELRSSGEGMDQSELDSSFPSTPMSREDSSVSFERLLSAAESETATEKLSANEVKLYKQLKAGMKKIDHLTELLRESEASSVRLGDQAKLLKEEIRRLERNQEREEGVSNLEYLKNVVLKFLHTQGAERSGLIPIVTKLLQLSPQEIKFLQETVKGNSVELPGAGGEDSLAEGKKGWTGYLHRWTGY